MCAGSDHSSLSFRVGHCHRQLIEHEHLVRLQEQILES